MTRTLQIIDSRKTLWAIGLCILLSLCVYIFCVNSAIRNVVAMENIKEESSLISNRISDLEYSYISTTNSITPNSASTLGLTDPVEKIFISRTHTTQLSLTNQ